MKNVFPILGFSCLLLSILLSSSAWAGPPFVTDDPEPVEFRHWEIYFASQYEHAADATTGTAPHFEINYGPAPDTMVHLILPLSYVHTPDGSTEYGLGDTEVGLKYRFVHETDILPQVGTFPLLEVPTGSSARGLGEGHASFFLPVWVQKSWGPWTTYGGGGYWFHNRGEGNKNYYQIGWEVQRDFSSQVTLGVEIFNVSSRVEGESGRTAVNAGTIFNLSEESHILFSAGRDLNGPSDFFMYLAYQLTIGPSLSGGGSSR